MESLSLETRRRVAEALDQGTESISSIARRFEVSRLWICQFIELRREPGDIVSRSGNAGRPRALSVRQLETIKDRLAEKPDPTFDELRGYCRTFGSIGAVFRVLMVSPNVFPRSQPDRTGLGESETSVEKLCRPH